jgi:predicted ATPase
MTKAFRATGLLRHRLPRSSRKEFTLDENFVLLSGCSGGGKSTLLAELRARGHHVVEEPGRRIVREELVGDQKALPWVDPAAFARRAIEMALADRQAARALSGWVVFDRGLIDAASALDALTGDAVLETLCTAHRYHRRVFMAPPWPEIYETDSERKHGFESSLAEYQRLATVIPALGYEAVTLPKTSVSARADFVLAILSPGAM